jgi:hypothetical protein
MKLKLFGLILIVFFANGCQQPDTVETNSQVSILPDKAGVSSAIKKSLSIKSVEVKLVTVEGNHGIAKIEITGITHGGVLMDWHNANARLVRDTSGKWLVSQVCSWMDTCYDTNEPIL